MVATSSPKESDLQQAAELLRSAQAVAVMTGAGVSAESGVPTFRGKDGLWKGFRAEELASPAGFAADPVGVWEWYNWRREVLAGVQPNPGHFALVELEQSCPQFTLITQNVDGLHRRAGSRAVLELHGCIWDLRCAACPFEQRCEGGPVGAEPRCPQCGSWLRPGVVWFGETLPAEVLESSAAAAQSCEVFVVVGTSAVVQPAASLIDCAAQNGGAVIEVNVAATPATSLATIALHGPSGEILPALVRRAFHP